MKYLNRLLAVASLFIAGPAFAQNAGTVTNHAFIIGKGAGTTGYTSLLCTSAQLAVGQSAADPICRTVTGDVTISAAGVTAIGAGKVTGAMLGAMTSAQLAGAVSDETGSGLLVFGTSPALTTPNLGTPSAATLTNATGLPISTGVSGLGTGVATFLATPSSANLAAAVTNETGSGALVFATSPTLVTPALGTPASGTLTNATGLPISTGVSGLGANVATFLATPSSANLRAALTDEVGTAEAYFVGGALGTPASGTATNLTGLPLTTGVTGTLPVANGGTGNTGTAWTSYTPTVGAQTGTITTSSATGAYQQVGKLVCFRLQVTITTNGTGGASVSATLPVTAVNTSFVFIGRAAGVSGLPLVAHNGFGAGQVNMTTMVPAYPGSDGEILRTSGCYEAA